MGHLVLEARYHRFPSCGEARVKPLEKLGEPEVIILVMMKIP